MRQSFGFITGSKVFARSGGFLSAVWTTKLPILFQFSEQIVGAIVFAVDQI